MPARPNALCLLCLLMFAPAAASQPAAPADPVVARALGIHQRVLTLGLHVDIPGAICATPALDTGAAVTNLNRDLTKMEKGAITDHDRNPTDDQLDVTIELVRRGYTEDQIRKIRGGNLMRVWRQVERIGSATPPVR